MSSNSNVKNEFTQQKVELLPPPPAPVVTESLWGVLTDERSHRFQPAADINLAIHGTSELHPPVGLIFNYVNGGALVYTDTPTATSFDGETQPAALVSYFDLGMRDKDYIAAFQHKRTLGNAFEEFFVHILKAGWYMVDFTCILTGPGGSNTQTTGICLVVYNSDGSLKEVTSPSAITNEPASDGCTLTLSNLRYYGAGQYIKPAIATTHQVNVRYELNGFGGSFVGFKTNFHITRVSNDPPATP